MLRGKQIVCLSSIDWDFNWQGHQEVMARFADAGNTVLFIENTGIRMPGLRDVPRLLQRLRDWRKGTQGIRKIRDNLYVCAPLMLPFPYSRLAQWLNRRLFMRPIREWARILGFERPILWTFLPTRVTLSVIETLDPELVVYYCIADFEQVGPARKVQRAEQQLLRRADVVFAQGEAIARRCRAHHPHPIDIFPFGVNLERFESFPGEAPDDIRRIPSPRVGYVGALQRHIDGPLLEALARRNPSWNIVIVGPQVEEFTYHLHAPNIHRLGAKPHADIPAYISAFDVCMIPYALNSYTQTVYPTKLAEYLVLGKPVVSTPLPEVLAFNDRHGAVVSIGRSREEFEEGIRRSLSDGSHDAVRQRVAVARQHGWSARLEAMSRIMADRLAASGRLRTIEWSRLMRRSVRQTRRRLLRTAWAAALGYGLLFHTPMLWWAAAPLKGAAAAPRPADAIVVFAGGVGESGRPGQGYEERVQHAVNLYEQGYAPHIIFSSGYTFAVKEIDVMQALAVSMGVPEEALVLENQATTTYENVAFTHRILSAHGWRTVLLVSSPYHMRRAGLVWRKQAPEVAVVAAPIPISRFYGHASRVKWRHIQAILHEYAGLGYYWWRGYL